MRTIAIVPLALLSLYTCLMAADQPENEITVHVDQPTVTLPNELYGLFYEDINYSCDGGLYAELVENRSFEYYPVPGWNPLSEKLTPLFAWEKVEAGGGRCELLVEDTEPLNANNTKYVRVKVTKPGNCFGLANLGFDGIHVVEGEKYDFSFYARRKDDLAAAVTVTLQGAHGSIARAVIDGLSEEWTRYEAELVATGSDEKARLVIRTGGGSDFYIDMVSLFPRKTFNGRKNGLRADLVQALVDLKPATFRFPGGCIVHGQGLANAYRWKDTVGPVEQRKPNWNRWGYHQTYGLGYYEYFLLCEDIGAEALPILPVGVSCGFTKPFDHAPIDKLQEWIDDAVDLVEFANGSVDTKWGGLRARMGHPTPFNLTYVGLGNEEHHTKEFEERFPHFVKALRDKYPEIKIVGTSGLGPEIPIYDFMHRHGIEISDEHYYQSPEWFIANQHRFDNFDRSKPKVFVGEYASRGNTLFNAIAEACYLTGIERNADIVPMTAYAPLLARYRFTQWKAADLIWFDHKTVVRTPNYYVQQLFSLNKGDRYLKNESRFSLPPDTEDAPAIGQIGVGTWDTTAVFDDIGVTSGGKALLDEDFSTGTANWQVSSGQYAVRDGAYVQTDVGQKPALSLYKTELNAADVVFSLRAKKTGGREGFLITFGSRSSDRFFWWNIGGWGNTRHAIEKGEGGKRQLASKAGSIKENVWYDIRVELTGKRIRCYLNDKLIHDVMDQPPRLSIGVAASRENASGDVILKIANPSSSSHATRVNLRGVDRVKPRGTLTVMTGKKGDINDLERPDRVKPRVTQIPVSTRFDYTIPPMSVQFIRVKSR